MPLDSTQDDDALEPMEVGCRTVKRDLYIEDDDMHSFAKALTGYDPNSIPRYPFVCGTIPRLHADDPEVDRLIMTNKPVVITGTKLVDSAKEWDLRYLETNMGKGKNFVFQSETKKFKYFDDKRVSKWPGFKRPTTRHSVTFSEFIQMLGKAHNSGQKIYMQQTLNDTVGVNIVQDFVRFRWDWCTKYQRMCSWGSLTSNLLLIGMEGNTTPTHYDEQENFFAQISGYKHCVLFCPDQFECLYPYPVSHPCDRQSQVDIDNPDNVRFPNFQKAKAVEAVVGPGDVLYIPMYWWHNIESVRSLHQKPIPAENIAPHNVPVTISVNFWYKAAPVPVRLEPSLNAHQKVAVMRNVEKMLGEVLGEPKEIGTMLRAIVNGRYEESPQSEHT